MFLFTCLLLHRKISLCLRRAIYDCILRSVMNFVLKYRKQAVKTKKRKNSTFAQFFRIYTKNQGANMLFGFHFGGRRWIRTIEATCNRFTVCPLWPLGNPPIFSSPLVRMRKKVSWSWWTDLNPRPADYKSAALPTELHQRICITLIATKHSLT